MIGPSELEIFRHSVKSVVEEMGITLQRTAYSTNIKIRRDHTCALFDADLRHIAQHDIAPQHVGSLISVVPRNIEPIEDELEPGDGILINDPYKGAVHLPDVMLISPIFYDANETGGEGSDGKNGEIVGYAANSAHHVDIGGPTPGGIPTDSTELFGEGIIIPGIKAVKHWEYDDEILSLVTRNVRGARMRLGDYRAQLSANRIGERRYVDLLNEYGPETVPDYLDELIAYTERRVRTEIEKLPDGTYRASDYMDGDGVVDEPVLLSLALEIEGDEMTIDFTGTADQNRGPLNCTPAMVFAGSMSVVMALLESDLPKNAGFYRPITTITPEGTMVNPTGNAPVAAGWEIAMRAGELVTKAIAEALPEKTIAASKGIVCNVAYGGTDPRDDDPYVYYETVGGGYGARSNKDGMEGVQTHFQNTANSPIEELETEIPLYVRRYELIEDSGGAGTYRGGLGIRRDMEFYDHEASFSLLSERATSDPWGLFGGHSGRRAKYVINPDTAKSTSVGSKSTTQLAPGDVASVQTPGGGGYGDPLKRDPEAVLEDVVNEKVSAAVAREEYGVVLDLDERTVDEAATTRRRSEMNDTDTKSQREKRGTDTDRSSEARESGAERPGETGAMDTEGAGETGVVNTEQPGETRQSDGKNGGDRA